MLLHTVYTNPWFAYSYASLEFSTFSSKSFKQLNIVTTRKRYIGNFYLFLKRNFLMPKSQHLFIIYLWHTVMNKQPKQEKSFCNYTIMELQSAWNWPNCAVPVKTVKRMNNIVSQISRYFQNGCNKLILRALLLSKIKTCFKFSEKRVELSPILSF